MLDVVDFGRFRGADVEVEEQVAVASVVGRVVRQLRRVFRVVFVRPAGLAGFALRPRKEIGLGSKLCPDELAVDESVRRKGGARKRKR